ncbi:MAG: hypothetical protein MN733_18655, partial [Nitrososphaera sp.]|nr:hypothetical protein [Nitrososphaera sp.]
MERRVTDLEEFKNAAALAAVDYVRAGHIVGLGTGSTARHVIELLGNRVNAGLAIKGVPTSEETADLARRAGIPLLSY